MKIQKNVKKPISELHEAKVNSRYHSDRQIDEYIRSLDMFGQTKPIVCDENGEVIIGNGLLLAMQKMNAKEADCYVVSEISEKDKKKMMLADNKIFELGMSLDEVMQDIVKEYKDIDIPGFNEDILTAIVQSAAETTKTIEAYGAYPEESLSNIERHASDVNREPIYTNAPSFQTKAEPIMSAENAPMVSAPVKEQQSETETGEVETERYVTCPHCGQRIKI